MRIDNTTTTMRSSPVDYLRSLFPSDQQRIRRPIVTRDEEELDHYNMTMVRLIRAADVPALRLKLEEGVSFHASNRNGETFLHLACRMGNIDTVRFLLEEVKLSPNLRDNLGRSVLHDVCWKSFADLKLMDYLLRVIAPEMLLVEDQRGDCAFDYVRREQWDTWNQFLKEREDLIARRIKIALA